MAVAVSGGSDSLALLFLLKRWRDEHAPSLAITAVTVDHALRPEAADEARQVGAICAGVGIRHVIRTWSEAKPASGIAEAARLARYTLLAEAAAEAGSDVVLTGHTMDDQAETVAMRGVRGDGRGLAGMARATLHADRMWIVRPLLAQRRAALRAILRDAGQGWIEDPSNEALTSERVRVRKALAADPDRIERLAAQADAGAAARIATNLAAARILSRGTAAAPGLASVPADLLSQGDEAGLLAFRALAAAIGGADHLPDEAAARRLLERLAAGDAGGALARAVVTRTRDALWLHREARGLPEAAAVAASALWDGRFRALAALEVAPMGVDRARAAGGFDALPRRLVTAALAAEPLAPFVPPPLTPPHKGEGGVSASGSPSPLWGGVRGGGRPGTAPKNWPLVRVVPPWSAFLPGFDVGLRNAVARLVGAAPVPASPSAAPSP